MSKSQEEEVYNVDTASLANTIFDWTMILTIIGVVVLMVYAVLSTITYLTLSSRIESNNMMDKMAKFTGQDAVVTNQGVVKVMGRLMVTIVLCTFLLAGGGFLLVRIVYEFILRFYSGFTG